MHNLINIFQMNKQAKHLRKNQTDAERLLWNRLRNRQLCNCKFRRQHEIGSYIVDFICLESKLIIELDGSGHILKKEHDANRTNYLESLGYNVIRFWNNEVVQELDNVLNAIYQEIVGNPSPQPSPLTTGERE